MVFYVDGVQDSATVGNRTGYTIATGTSNALVLGQDQDAVGNTYDAGQVFSGTLYDVRIFSTVRTGAEISANAFGDVASNTSGLLANWKFNDFSTSNVVPDAVGSNTLSIGQATGTGSFTSNTPSLGLAVSENAANNTVVGTVNGVDVDDSSFTYSIQSQSVSGAFQINSSTGQVSVLNGSLLDFDTLANHLVTVANDGYGRVKRRPEFTISLTNVNETPSNIGVVSGTNLVTNSSFETNTSGWTLTGTGTARTGGQGASAGSFALGFNTSNSANDGVATTALTTVIGQTYTVSFDVGAMASRQVSTCRRCSMSKC